MRTDTPEKRLFFDSGEARKGSVGEKDTPMAKPVLRTDTGLMLRRSSPGPTPEFKKPSSPLSEK